MTYTFSVIVWTFSSWSKDSESTNHQFQTTYDPKSRKGQLLFVFILERKYSHAASSRKRHYSAFHEMPKPKPHTGKGWRYHDWFKQSRCFPGLGRRASNVKPQVRDLVTRKKWEESCSVDSQQWLLRGRIYNVFTTNYLDFWKSKEQVNRWNFSGLL